VLLDLDVVGLSFAQILEPLYALEQGTLFPIFAPLFLEELSSWRKPEEAVLHRFSFFNVG